MSNLTISDIYVLLVEPSKAQQRIIDGYLDQLSIKNRTWVSTATEALERMASHKPDLLVSAMHMEDMTGTELVQTVRMDAKFNDVPFMLISSETNYRYLEPIRQAGVIAILKKPFSFEQLKKAVESTLYYIDPDDISTEDFVADELRVLVVDDSFTARRHISRVLNNMGIVNIQTAENGKEALDLVGKQYFDLLVTDYNMPEMDGGELVELVRSGSQQASIPILMVSSETDTSRIASVQQSGVSAICDKPFEFQTVKELIQRIV
ncbi:MAG: response regulator [Gammaproteobacteria bacterium]|nr:response regulator [Gammaproteobacteria bacterium]MDH5802049.1 response regulator [Gammaproteobacteria bacterium]